MENLTCSRLYEICQEHDYVLLRLAKNNALMGVNCRIARMPRFETFASDKHHTEFISYIPCTFQEYISYKHPFK